jgi:hypothetical protein
MGIKNWFVKRRPDEVLGSKVLVCSLGAQFDELVQTDAEVYKRFYPSTVTAQFSTLGELTQAIGHRYDVVHIFCNVPPSGIIVDAEHRALTGTQIIEACCAANVKLLWVGNDNPPEGYIKNFKAQGKRINLVMTITRNGPKFSTFLDKLLSKMFAGDRLPLAWASLVPQAKGSWQEDLPGCIFFAGRGTAVLR